MKLREEQMRSKFTVVFFLSAVLLLSACANHDGLNGTYANKGMTYEFQSNGKVFITALGTTIESTYELDGNKIKLQKGGMTVILSLMNDGAIHGPLGMTLIKQ